MRSWALALKRWARTVSALVRSPLPSTFTPSTNFLIIPRFRRISGVTMVPASKTSRVPRFTSANSFLKRALVKPRLGTRRWRGICPPSNPSLWLKPLRLFCPFSPRPDVLPRPLPGPRPTRLRLRVLPLAGFRLFRPMVVSLLLDDADEVGNGVDHPPDLRRVRALDHLVHAAQAEAADGGALAVGAPDDGADLPDLQRPPARLGAGGAAPFLLLLHRSFLSFGDGGRRLGLARA